MTSAASQHLGVVSQVVIWVFFIINAAKSGEGRGVSISEEFHLEDDLSG
jgi:hypothetical protein